MLYCACEHTCPSALRLCCCAKSAGEAPQCVQHLDLADKEVGMNSGFLHAGPCSCTATACVVDMPSPDVGTLACRALAGGTTTQHT